MTTELAPHAQQEAESQFARTFSALLEKCLADSRMATGSALALFPEPFPEGFDDWPETTRAVDLVGHSPSLQVTVPLTPNPNYNAWLKDSLRAAIRRFEELFSREGFVGLSPDRHIFTTDSWHRSQRGPYSRCKPSEGATESVRGLFAAPPRETHND